MPLNPEKYEAWFKTPLGRWADPAERKLLSRGLKPGPGGRLLDAGCGTAHFTGDSARDGAQVFGLDSSLEMITYARSRHPQLKLVVGDAGFLPFKNNSFDSAAMITVLEFVPEPRRALDELARVLEPSGRAVVGFLNRRGPWGILRRTRGLLGNSFWRKTRMFGRREMSGLLARSGFVVTKARSALLGSFVLIEATKPALIAPSRGEVR